MRRLRLLALLLLPMAVAGLPSCSSEPDPHAVPEGLLDGIAPGETLADALRASRTARRAEYEREFDLATERRYDWLRGRTDGDAQVRDHLIERWREEPGRILWIHAAWYQASVRTDSATVAEILAPLPDSDPRKRLAEHWSTIDDIDFAFPFPGFDGMPRLDEEDRLLLRKWIARGLSREGLHDAAIDTLMTALPPARALGSSILEAHLWSELGRRFESRQREGDLGNAVHAFHRAMELLHEAGQYHGMLVMACNLPDPLAGLRKQGAYLDLLNWIDAVAPATGSNYEHVIALNRLSGTYIDLGETERALETDRRALHRMRSMGEDDQLAYLHLNIADDFVRLGYLDSARVEMTRAQEVASRLPSSHQLWAVYTDDADLALMEGDIRRADSLRALAAKTDSLYRDPEGEQLRLFRLAEHGLLTGNPKLVEEALPRMENLRGSPGEIRPAADMDFEIGLLLARLRMASGEHIAAARELDACERALGALHSPRRSARLSSLRGRLLEAGGDGRSALACYRAALDSALVAGPAPASRQGLILARALLDRGRHAEAESLLLRMEIGHFGHGGGYRTLQERRYWLARCERARGDEPAARRRLETMLAEEANTLPRDLEILSRVELGRINSGSHRVDAARRELETALGLIHDGHRYLERPGFRYAAEEVLRDIVDGLLAITPPEDPRGLDYHRRMLDLLAGAPAEPSLRFDTPTLVFFLGESSSRAWLIRAGRVHCRELPDRHGIEQLAERIVDACSDPRRPRDLDAERQLAAAILAPFGELRAQDELLQILPDGGLRGLPWALLAEGVSTVLDRGPLVILPDLQLADTSSTFDPALSMTAFGCNRAAAPGLPELVHAEEEARSLAARWPDGRALLDRQVTAAEILRAAREPGMMHLAMHTRLGTSAAGQTTLALPGGGRLDASAIAKESWRSDLITLSGCETVRGGRPDLDLAAAFLAGGARAVLASPLRVPDEQGRGFFLRFYELVQSGESPESALRRTQIETRAGPPGGAAPYFWAGFRILRRGR